jgi:integrase
MANLRLKYVQQWVDGRNGKAVPRYYFRRPGCSRVALPGQPGTSEFMEAYAAAMAHQPPQRTVIERVAAPGTMSYLRLSYLNSAAYRQMERSTQGVYRNVLDRFCEQFGHLHVKTFRRKHMIDLMGKLADKPGSASNFRKAIRAMCKHAMDIEMIASDPTRDVKPIRSKSADGIHSWTEDEVTKFEVRHAVGTKARLAFDLLVYTGQRRSDVVRMGRQHVRDGLIHVRQQKTGVELWLPILPDLQQTIDASPTGQLTFLVTEYGAPFSAAGFGNKFREWCNEAGLPQCSAHGLRKVCARRLADAGCTAHQIASWTGHETLREVQRYAKGADQRRLALEAMNKLRTKVSTQNDRLTKTG